MLGGEVFHALQVYSYTSILNKTYGFFIFTLDFTVGGSYYAGGSKWTKMDEVPLF